jgi:hypothetical protein
VGATRLAARAQRLARASQLQGSYHYPDGSFYTGAWKAGKKHGQGAFWDTAGGCLAGGWERGALKGEGRYDQPNYHFEGRFVKSVPAGAVQTGRHRL